MSRVLRILECVSLDISKPIFFSGLQHSRDRTLPTVWPSMLSYLPTASSPQFGRAEYPQICVFYCEVRSVRIRFSLLQWLLVTKVNFLFNVSIGDIHISDILVNFTVYTSGYPRKTFAGIKTDSVFFRIQLSLWYMTHRSRYRFSDVVLDRCIHCLFIHQTVGLRNKYMSLA